MHMAFTITSPSSSEKHPKSIMLLQSGIADCVTRGPAVPRRLLSRHIDLTSRPFTVLIICSVMCGIIGSTLCLQEAGKPREAQIPSRLQGKAVPLQAWSGLEGSSKLGLPDFVTTAQDGGRLSALRTLLLLLLHPSPRWDSNPRSQQASSRRPTP